MSSENLSEDLKAEFSRELRAVWDVAYRVALRMCGNPDDAADVLQDATLAAFSNFDSFQKDTNFKAWFLRITTNRALNFSRRANREVALSSLQIGEENAETDDVEELFLYEQARKNGLLARGDDPAQKLMAQIDGETIRAALNQLAPEFRAVAVLCLVEGLSYEEVAALLDCPLGTVRSRLFRSRKTLQKILWEQFGASKT